MSETDEITISPHPGQQKVLTSEKRFILAIAGIQCFERNEFVYTPNGIKKVSKIKDGDEIIGGKVENAKQYYLSDIYEIIFSNGIKIKLSGEHPLWFRKGFVRNQIYWETVNNILKRKKKIARKRSVGYVLFQDSRLVGQKLPHAKLLGYLFSDGYMAKGQELKFTNTNNNLLLDVEKLAKKFGCLTSKSEKGNGFDLFLKGSSRGHDNPLRLYIDNLHTTKQTFGKILNANKKDLLEFVKGYFNGDGCLIINRRKNSSNRRKMIYIDFSIGGKRQRAYEFQYILWRLGFVSKVLSEKMKPNFTTFYRIRVLGEEAEKLALILDSIKYPEKFREANNIIGFHRKEKRDNDGCWIGVRNIKKIGKGTVIGWQTKPSNEIISYCGMKTHNSGKTFCGCIWSQLQIQKNPQGNGLICALSYDQVNNAVITKFFQLFPGYRKYYNKKDKTIYLPTGGNIFFRSLEEAKYVEGITAHWAWIDEADLVGFRSYLIVRGRLNATEGPLLMTSSLSDNSWLAEYMDKFNANDFEIVNWASNMNPSFSKAEWDALKNELDPTIFRRRYEANLAFSTGRVYSGFEPARSVLEKVPESDPIKRAMIGIDWGYVDPCAIEVIGLSEKKNVYILDEFAVEGMNLDVIETVTRKFIDKYHVKAIYADPENKTTLKSLEGKIRMPINAGVRDINYGTSLIRNLIFQERFFVLDSCTRVLQELKHYRFKEGLIGRSEEPEDENNHSLDAIRYVVATYPIPSVRYKKKEISEDLPVFWARRTSLYKNEFKKDSSGYLKSGENKIDMIIP